MKSKYYILCLSESSRSIELYGTEEELLEMLNHHIEQHNSVIEDPVLQFHISDFELIKVE